MWFLQPGLTFTDLILKIIAILIITFLVLPLHEFAKAWVAYQLGDDTAKNEGTLTLNPLAHFSASGAICMLLFNFGWSKPVTINPNNFENPHRDMAFVALAGPIANVLAALVGGFLLNFTPFISSSAVAILVSKFILIYISISTYLTAIDLLPIPPMAGFQIIQSFIPERIMIKYYRNISAITWIMILLILLGVFDGFIGLTQGLLYNFIIKATHIPFINV